MNIGFWMCIVLVPIFGIMGLLFGVIKEKAARFVSGFNTLSEGEKALYDKAYIVRDIRNSCFIWTSIMLFGGLGSLFLTQYFAFAAYILWGILFFKNVHVDTKKAFEKYLLK